MNKYTVSVIWFRNGNSWYFEYKDDDNEDDDGEEEEEGEGVFTSNTVGVLVLNMAWCICTPDVFRFSKYKFDYLA